MPKVTMPQLGESVAEGTIGKWLKNVGDPVAKYEPIVEVITDKVNAEVPSPFEGTLTEILVQEGETVPNNAEIAVIEAAGAAQADQPASPAETADSAQPAQAETPTEAERTVLGSGGFGPAGSDERRAEEMPAERQPPAPAPTAPAPAAPTQTAPAPAPAAPAPVATAPAAGDRTSGNGASVDGYGGRMTPAVRRLAREHSIDLSLIAGTGHGGRVTRDDVQRFIEGGGATAAEAQAPAAPPSGPPTQASVPAPASAPEASAAPGQDQLKPMTPMRSAIARHMVASKSSVPHAYTTVEVDMSGIVALREATKAQYQAREGAALSFVAIVGKAVVEALRHHPDLNAHWTDQGVLRKASVNLGVAVAVDDGLIVPVIRDADRYSIHGLNQFVQDFATRARANRLRQEDITGGTFTLNNTGWFGSVASQPIVNVPEVAILSMEAIVKRAVVIETPAGDTIGIRPMMNLCVSFDHRATDGAQVGRFVQDVKRWLESADPQTPVW